MRAVIIMLSAANSLAFFWRSCNSRGNFYGVNKERKIRADQWTFRLFIRPYTNSLIMMIQICPKIVNNRCVYMLCKFLFYKKDFKYSAGRFKMPCVRWMIAVGNDDLGVQLFSYNSWFVPFFFERFWNQNRLPNAET